MPTAHRSLGVRGARHVSPCCLVLLLAFPANAAVTVSGAWARATLPSQNTAVAYMTLTSPTPDALTGADSAEAGMVMLHQSTHANGMAGMADMDRVPLPAGRAVALAPNGAHMMLMDLTHPLKPGGTLHLTLHFAHAGDQRLDVPVRPIGATGP